MNPVYRKGKQNINIHIASYLAGCKAILQIPAAQFILGKEKVTFSKVILSVVATYRVGIKEVSQSIASVQKSKEQKSEYPYVAALPSNKLGWLRIMKIVKTI